MRVCVCYTHLRVRQVEGTDIKRLMDTWTIQMGFPVVKLDVVDRNEIRLRQERFLLDPSADKTQPPSNFRYKQMCIYFRY